MTFDATASDIDSGGSEASDAAESPVGSPIVDLLSLLGGVNPLATVGKVLETVVSMSSETIQSVSTLNDTMIQMNRMVHRMNSLLDEIEVPIRQVVPLMEVSLNQAKGTMKKVDAVIGQIGSLPGDVAKAVSTLGDLASRLGPLAQFAETAGGLFGIKPSPS